MKREAMKRKVTGSCRSAGSALRGQRVTPGSCVQAGPRATRSPPESRLGRVPPGTSRPGAPSTLPNAARGARPPARHSSGMRPHPRLRPLPGPTRRPRRPGGPPGLPHLALVALLLFGAEVDRRQAGQVEGAAPVRARDRPQQEQRQQQQPWASRWRRRGRPGAHAGGCERRAAEPRGRRGSRGRGGPEITWRPERRAGRLATASSGCAGRHRGPRDRNRSGPRRSMRGPACTCSVRAPPASAAGCFRAGRGGGPRSGLAALRPDDFRLRASGSRRPAPGAALTPRNAWFLGNFLVHARQLRTDEPSTYWWGPSRWRKESSHMFPRSK